MTAARIQPVGQIEFQVYELEELQCDTLPCILQIGGQRSGRISIGGREGGKCDGGGRKGVRD